MLLLIIASLCRHATLSGSPVSEGSIELLFIDSFLFRHTKLIRELDQGFKATCILRKSQYGRFVNNNGILVVGGSSVALGEHLIPFNLVWSVRVEADVSEVVLHLQLT